MAARKDIQTVPADEYPRCEVCGWWDRKLRIVGSTLSPDERMAVHKWARHEQPLPSAWFIPTAKDGDDQ